MGMMDKDFDFVVTATRTENNRKLKVPGDVPAVGKMSIEIARLREEIKTKTVPQLQEIVERQERILSNKVLVKKLPDKGEKARKTKEMVENLIKDKNEVKGLEKEMEKMKIDTEKFEWKGNLILDSDDDSDPEEDGPARNPLSVLAQGIVPPVSSKAKEREEEKQSEGLSGLELYAVKEAEKVDNLDIKDNFVPYKAIKSNEVDEDTKKTLIKMNDVLKNAVKPELSKFEKRKQDKRLQKPRTPAIPMPEAYNCATKQLSLTESLRLQQEQDKKFREVQRRHAEQKLAAAAFSSSGQEEKYDGGRFQEYRDTREEEEQEEDSGDEGVGVVGITQVADEQDE